MRQLLFAPPAKRIEQLKRAELLHDQIDPQVNYPYDFLFYRITGYQSEAQASDLLVGSAVVSDLRLMIDRLSRSVRMPQDPDEPAATIRELASQLKVSVKTVERYRRMGLRWRWMTPAGGGRRVVVFTAEAVDRFVATHGKRVARAGRFTQIEAQDRQSLTDRARALNADGQLSLNQVARRLADENGRAVETMRLILEQHDKAHADQPIFANRSGKLTARQKQLIARALRMGVSADKLARRFGRTRSTIYRAARDRRVSDLRRLDISFVRGADFDRPDADELIPDMVEEAGDPPPQPRDPQVQVDDLPSALRALYGRRGLPSDRLRSVLVRYNYLKCRAATLRDGLDRYDPRAADLDRIDASLDAASRLRHLLIEANLHAVLSVARRHLIDHEDRSPGRLADLLIAGNGVLLDAIDQFDFTERQAFEPFLTWRLMRRFAAEPQQASRAQRRLTEQDMAKAVLASVGWREGATAGI